MQCRLGIWGVVIGLLLSACTSLQPPSDGSAYDRGLAAFTAGHYGLAAEALREAVDQDPGSISALNALGATYDRIGRYDLAQRQYRKALALDPTSPQTINNIGYSYLLQGRPDVALVYLRDASGQADPAFNETLSANIEAAEQAVGSAPETQQASRQAPASPDPANPQIRRKTGKIQTMRTAPQAPAGRVAVIRTKPPTEAAPAAEPDAVVVEPEITPAPTAAETAAVPPGAELNTAPLTIELETAPATARNETIASSPKSRSPHPPEIMPAPQAAKTETAPATLGSQTMLLAPPVEAARPAPPVATAPREAETEAAPPAAETQAAPQIAKKPAEAAPRISENKTKPAAPAAEGAPQIAETKPPVLPRSPGLRPARPKTALATVPHPVPVSRPGPDTPIRLEISNGADRLDMAERMRDHLKGRGWAVTRLSEAAHHSYRRSTIYYRNGHSNAAKALQRNLAHATPQLAIERRDGQPVELVLQLGNDLLAFDQRLFAQATDETNELAERSNTPQKAAPPRRRVAEASLPKTRGTKKGRHTAKIEVANGTGRSNMAARMSDHLSESGFRVSWITNAASFDHQASQITYRPGSRAAATALRDKLPVKIRMERSSAQRADIKLTLGADLIGFDQELIALQTPAVIEVSNGAGRNRMAARMRTYLTGEGFIVGRITNADHFEHETTTIFYRPGLRTHAQELAAILPAKITLQERSALATGLRLELGRDLLGFDSARAKAPQPASPGRSG